MPKFMLLPERRGDQSMHTSKHLLFAVLLLILQVQQAFAEGHFHCREVGAKWVWFEDHLVAYVTYSTRGPQGRTYEVGTGISVNGSPWGKRKRYTGDAEFNAYGMGALHIRKKDAGPNFVVCASGLGIGTLPIIPKTEF